MPFADAGCVVARVFQHVGDGDFVRMKALVTAWEEDRAHGNSLVVSPSQKCCARARTDRTADIEVIKNHSLSSHLIKAWSFGDRRAIKADITISHIIDKDENNVGLCWSRLRLLQRLKAQAKGTEKCKAEAEFHCGT